MSAFSKVFLQCSQLIYESTARPLQESRDKLTSAQDIGRGTGKQGERYSDKLSSRLWMQQICPEGQQWVPEALPDVLCKAALSELCLVVKQRN